MSKLQFKIPEGYELDKENSTDETIIYKKKENKYPLSVDDVKGRLYSIVGNKVIDRLYDPKYRSIQSDLSTKEIAEAFLALMQLVELRDAWNEIDGFKADWNLNHDKYIIEYYLEKIETDSNRHISKVLHFGSKKTRDLFLETFKDLIETAKELL